MKYNQTIKLKNGKNAIIRNATGSDGSIVLDAFKAISAETDYLLSYPDEILFTPDEESSFLQKKADSANEIHIIALVDGVVVGIAGIDSCGSKYKVKHRAGMGVSVLKDYWGLGIGSALIYACIKCTKDAGYTQLMKLALHTPSIIRMIWSGVKSLSTSYLEKGTLLRKN